MNRKHTDSQIDVLRTARIGVPGDIHCTGYIELDGRCVIDIDAMSAQSRMVGSDGTAVHRKDTVSYQNTAAVYRTGVFIYRTGIHREIAVGVDDDTSTGVGSVVGDISAVHDEGTVDGHPAGISASGCRILTDASPVHDKGSVDNDSATDTADRKSTRLNSSHSV